MSEIHGAVGSYVIDALDADELDEFEAHLATCDTCSREVVEFCETAAQLSLLAGTAGPPPLLRGSILSEIKAVRPLPPELPEMAPVRAESSAPRRARVEIARPDVANEPVDELAVRRQRRRTRLLTLAVAAVSVLALSLGIGVINLAQDRQSQVAAADLETRLETELYTAPDVKIVPAKTANGGQVSFVSSKSLNKALFVNNNLPTPGDRLTYQLWTLKGRDATADNLLDGSMRTQWFKNSIVNSTGLAVTIEPEAGSVVPTTPVQANAAI